MELTDVSPDLGHPMVVNGVHIEGEPIVQTYFIARWGLSGSFPVAEVQASADLFPHEHAGQTFWLVQVNFWDLNGGRVSAWKTFRVDFPDAKYDGSHDDELVEALRQKLSHAL